MLWYVCVRTHTDMYTHTLTCTTHSQTPYTHRHTHGNTHTYTQTCTHIGIHTHTLTCNTHTHTLCSNNNKPYKKSMQVFSFPHSPSSSQFVRGVPLCAPHLPVSFQRTPSPYPLGHVLVHCVLRARAFLNLRSLALGSWGGEKLTEQSGLC